jgi:protein TonB
MMLPEAPQQQTLFGESYCTTLNRLTPLRVGGTLPPPVKIKDVRPLYPEDAQDARIQGVVIVEAIVDAEGRVANARIVRSIPLFNESALDAVSKWQYRPVLVNGDPVPFITTVTVNYAMQ